MGLLQTVKDARTCSRPNKPFSAEDASASIFQARGIYTNENEAITFAKADVPSRQSTSGNSISAKSRSEINLGQCSALWSNSLDVFSISALAERAPNHETGKRTFLGVRFNRAFSPPQTTTAQSKRNAGKRSHLLRVINESSLSFENIVS